MSNDIHFYLSIKQIRALFAAGRNLTMLARIIESSPTLVRLERISDFNPADDCSDLQPSQKRNSQHRP